MIKFFQKYKKFLFDFLKKYIYVLVSFYFLVSVSFVLIFLNFSSIFDAIELKLFDLRVVLDQQADEFLKTAHIIYLSNLKTVPDKNIIVFSYNDDLLSTLKSYPSLNISNWPIERYLWADIIKFLRRGQNSVTLIDVRFPAPDKNRNNDVILSREIKKNNNVILGFSMLTSKEKAQNENELINNIKDLVDKKNQLSPRMLNQIVNKFITIPQKNFFSNLDFSTRKNIIFAIPQDLMEIYYKNVRGIGIVNVQMGYTSDVIRENKPLYNYRFTDRFALSLSFAGARHILADYKHNRIKFKKDLLGGNLVFGTKLFPLNENGNIYIDWKGQSSAYEDIALLESIAYEQYETMDLKNGYIISPEEQNFYWQSYFNYLLTDDLVDIYYQRIVSGYSLFLLKTLDFHIDGLDENDYKKNQLQINLTKIIPAIISHVNLYGNTNIALGNRDNSLFDILLNHNDNSLFTYLQEYKYNIKDVSYNYLNNSASFDNFFNGEYKAFFKHFNYSNPTCPSFMQSKNYGNYITTKLDTFYNLTKNSLPYSFINKAIVIGQTQTGTDIHTVPFDNMYPGPKIIANVLDNYLNDGTLYKKTMVKLNNFFTTLLVILLSILTIYLTIKRENYLVSFIYFLILLILFILLNVLCFILPFIKIWINMTYPVMFMIFAFLGTISFKINILDKDKKQIKSAFGRFVSPQILDSILNDPEFLSNQFPKKKHITVMFSDIRNFTSYSEKLPPEELVQQLNEYLSEMVEVIMMEHNGTFDKFMGDAIMAFWGDPIIMDNNAKRAVLAALSMREHLILLNEKWKKEGKPPFRIGIGINTGDMIVGFSGSHRFRNYTVLGDNVNIAARIEGLNKQFGTEIIISQSTYDEIKDIIECKFLGSVTVKGKEDEIRIYEVINLKNDSGITFNKPLNLYIESNKSI